MYEKLNFEWYQLGSIYANYTINERNYETVMFEICNSHTYKSIRHDLTLRSPNFEFRYVTGDNGGQRLSR